MNKLKRKSPKYTYEFYALLTTIFFLPIPLGSNRPWAWSLFEIAIFTTFIFILFRLKQKHLAALYNKYNFIVFLWLGFIFLSILQLIPIPDNIMKYMSENTLEMYKSVNISFTPFSLDVGQSIISLLKTASYFCLFCLVLIIANTHKRIKLVLSMMVVSGTFQALYGSMELLTGIKESIIFNLKVDNRATGSFVYHNHFANFLMLCLSAGLALLVSSLQSEKLVSTKDRLRAVVFAILSSKALIRISLAIMVIALVMSKSRMGNTAFFVSMTLTGCLALMLFKQRSRGLTILLVSMVIIDLLIVSAFFGLENVKDRLVETNLEQEARVNVLAESLPIIREFPLFGTGAGSFYTIYSMYQTTNSTIFFDHAHNEYLQFFIEYGLIGVMLLASMVFFSLFKALQAMRKKGAPFINGLGFGCTMAIIGMLIHITVDFPLQAYANTCYFIIFIALPVSATNLKTKRVKRSIHSPQFK